MYTYIYIERERDVCMYMCIYIYIYTHIGITTHNYILFITNNMYIVVIVILLQVFICCVTRADSARSRSSQQECDSKAGCWTRLIYFGVVILITCTLPPSETREVCIREPHTPLFVNPLLRSPACSTLSDTGMQDSDVEAVKLPRMRGPPQKTSP